MIGILVKNRLRSMFGAMLGKAFGENEERGKKYKRAALFIFVYLFLLGTFVFMTSGVSYMLAESFLPATAWLYYLIFIGFSVSVIFIFGIFETKTVLFECKDNELLLSMPIKPRDIAASRMLVVMLSNYSINAIIMVPAIVFYGIFAKDVKGIIGGIFIFLIIPLFATALSSLAGYLVAEISRKIKHKNFVTIFFTLVLLGIYFVVIEVMGNNLEGAIEYLVQNSENIGREYKFLFFLGNASLLKPLPFITVVLISVLSAATAYFLISRSYLRIVTDRSGAPKVKYKEKRLKKGSALFAVVKKDIRCFFSSPLYVLNGGLGLIMALVLGVAAIVKKSSLKELANESSLSSAHIAIVGTALIILVISMSIISAASLSIEGKKFWIIKSMPLPARTVLLSKALMQAIISAPMVFVATVLLMIASAPPPIYVVICIIASQLGNIMLSLFGILMNVAFPKFEFDNEAQVVKQSLAVLLSMFGGIIVSFLLLAGVFILSLISRVLGALLLILLPLLLIAVEFIVLLGPASNKFKRMNL